MGAAPYQGQIAPVLANRSTGLALLGLGAALVLATALHLPLYDCPLRATTGVRCPGCGMTRAIAALATGHPAEAMRHHPFSPLCAMGVAVLVVFQFLPEARRRAAASAVARMEARTRIVPIALGAFLVYGLVRMVADVMAKVT